MDEAAHRKLGTRKRPTGPTNKKERFNPCMDGLIRKHHGHKNDRTKLSAKGDNNLQCQSHITSLCPSIHHNQDETGAGAGLRSGKTKIKSVFTCGWRPLSTSRCHGWKTELADTRKEEPIFSNQLVEKTKLSWLFSACISRFSKATLDTFAQS